MQNVSHLRIQFTYQVLTTVQLLPLVAVAISLSDLSHLKSEGETIVY